MGSLLKFWTFIAIWCAVIYLDAGMFMGGGGYGHHQAPSHDFFHVHLVQVNHTIRCGAKGGTCLFVDQCDITDNIYKLGLCGYNYSVVCCISRMTVCNRNWGFCINTTDSCRASGNYYSWFGCNSTHRCCRPYVKKLRIKEQVHGHGGGGHRGGGYGGGGGGYGGGGGGYGGGGGGYGGQGGGGYGGGGHGGGGGGYGGGGGGGYGGGGGGYGGGGGGYGGGGNHGGGGRFYHKKK